MRQHVLLAENTGMPTHESNQKETCLPLLTSHVVDQLKKFLKILTAARKKDPDFFSKFVVPVYPGHASKTWSPLLSTLNPVQCIASTTIVITRICFVSPSLGHPYHHTLLGDILFPNLKGVSQFHGPRPIWKMLDLQLSKGLLG
jgi:hypothetical protein